VYIYIHYIVHFICIISKSCQILAYTSKTNAEVSGLSSHPWFDLSFCCTNLISESHTREGVVDIWSFSYKEMSHSYTELFIQGNELFIQGNELFIYVNIQEIFEEGNGLFTCNDTMTWVIHRRKWIIHTWYITYAHMNITHTYLNDNSLCNKIEKNQGRTYVGKS